MGAAEKIQPVNYTQLFADRLNLANRLMSDRKTRAAFFAHYKNSPVDFIRDWILIYEPRNSGSGLPVFMPFNLWPRQVELIEWIHARVENKESGIIEKSRDSGATYIACAYAVWMWIFSDGASVGIGSRKLGLVDQLGNMDTMFEKIRFMIRNLPPFFLPKGFDEKTHLNYCRILNPETRATIVGEGGDNIGRGGRNKVYFPDEFAFMENQEMVEQSLSATTDSRIYISTANGTNNVFYRMRMSGLLPTFTFSWRDDPRKDEEWYEKKKAELPPHVFAMEYDIDYRAAVEGILIKPMWVDAAIGALAKLGIDRAGEIVAGFDVADAGADKNAVIVRHGQEVTAVKEWSGDDSMNNARWAADFAQEHGAERLVFDAVGIGAGAKSAFRRIEAKFKAQEYNGGGAIDHPNSFYAEGKRNKDMFANMKAQQWWLVRDMFENTFRAISGEPHDAAKIISISESLPMLAQLRNELSQVTYGTDAAGRILIDKAPKGAKSPNLADAMVMAYRKNIGISFTVI